MARDSREEEDIITDTRLFSSLQVKYERCTHFLIIYERSGTQSVSRKSVVSFLPLELESQSYCTTSKWCIMFG